MSAYRGDRANGLGAPALIEYNTNTSPKTPQRLVGPMGVGRPLGKCARGGQEPTVSAALFGNIGSQPGASSACNRCSGELLSPVLGCLGRQVYIFHNDLDDLVGVVLGRWRV